MPVDWLTGWLSGWLARKANVLYSLEADEWLADLLVGGFAVFLSYLAG